MFSLTQIIHQNPVRVETKFCPLHAVQAYFLVFKVSKKLCGRYVIIQIHSYPKHYFVILLSLNSLSSMLHTYVSATINLYRCSVAHWTFLSDLYFEAKHFSFNVPIVQVLRLRKSPSSTWQWNNGSETKTSWKWRKQVHRPLYIFISVAVHITVLLALCSIRNGRRISRIPLNLSDH